MEIEVAETPAERVAADVLAFPVSDPVRLSPVAQELDRVLGGRLAHLVDDGEVNGEAGAVAVVHTVGELAAHRVAAAGVGSDARLDGDGVRTAAARVAAHATNVGAKTIAWVVDDDGRLPPAEQARAAVDGIAIGSHDAARWKSEAPTGPVERLVLCGPGASAAADEAGRANVAAAWTNRCRDLVNAPPNELTPARLAEYAEELAAGHAAFAIDVLGLDQIRAAGMGALAAVGQGSDNAPRLITIRYEPDGARADLVLGLVGKAITFDTGGISLKPAEGMDGMKADMSGGAAVLAALGAIAELEIPLRVIGVVGACENMPGGHAYRPGDIVTASNGKTIEVTNTDAEGRLVLADALWHARRSGATHLLDLATLTGAMATAMGDFYAGLFGNDAGWVEQVRAAGEATGDHAWPWPLHPTYRRYLSSAFADMKNSSARRLAAPIYAACFLQEFVGDGPWAHLDIAGTAFLDLTRGDYYFPQQRFDSRVGATGYGVRLLAELARRLTA